MKKSVVAILSLSRINKSLPSFKKEAFEKEALQIYCEVFTGFANGTMKQVQNLCTPPVFTDLLADMKSRRASEKHNWKMDEHIRTKVLHMRAFKFKDQEFAQVTIFIESMQSLNVHAGSGGKVQGTVGKGKEAITDANANASASENTNTKGSFQKKHVSDIFVLERNLTNRHGRWRFCGKL